MIDKSEEDPNQMSPSIAVSEEIYEKYFMVGMNILPGIYIISYLTETQAKLDAHYLNVPFMKIKTSAILGLSK
jgi:hypothetical protein